MNILLQKRQKFHSSIRHEQIEEYIKKIRYEMLQNHLQQSLNRLVKATNKSITEYQLEQLLMFCNQRDYNNAIIHLGNLMIDNIIDPIRLFTINQRINNQFQLKQKINIYSLNQKDNEYELKQNNKKFQLAPRQSPYWSWLIRVLLFNFNYCNQKLFQYIIDKISYGLSSNFILQNCLQILKKIIRKYKNKVTDIILHNQKLILKVKQYTLHVNKNISQLSYEIIDLIIQTGDNQTHLFIKISGINQIVRIINTGFHKSDPNQKKFPLIICRIINNIFSSGILINEFIRPCINLISHTKQHIKVQLSYVCLSYIQNASVQHLQIILNLNILQKFQQLLSYSYQKQSYYKQIKQNISSALNLLIQKCQSLDKRIYYEVKSRIQMFKYRCTQQFINKLKFRKNNTQIIKQTNHYNTQQNAKVIQTQGDQINLQMDLQ